MKLTDLLNESGDTPAASPVAPVVTTPPPTQQRYDTSPSVPPVDPADEEAVRNQRLLEEAPREPAPKEDPAFASSVPERQPAFEEVAAEDYDAALSQAGDTPPQERTEPTPPAQPQSSGDIDDDLKPDIDPLGEGAVRLPWEMQDEQPSYSSQGTYHPVEDHGGYDDNGRGDAIRMKASGLLDKPKQFFAERPQMKRPAVMGAIGLVIALVVVTMFGGGSPESQTPTANPGAPVEEPIVTTDEGLGEPVVLDVSKVAADCGAGMASPRFAFSNDPKEAWICPRANGIDGQVMNILFERSVMVKSVTISPGFNYVAPNGKDRWNEYRVITKIRWKLGGKTFIHDINPTRSGSTYTFPGKGIATTAMSLTVFQTERPNAAGVESATDSEGGLLPPMGPQSGPENSDVDKAIAVNSLVIHGYELG